MIIADVDQTPSSLLATLNHRKNNEITWNDMILLITKNHTECKFYLVLSCTRIILPFLEKHSTFPPFYLVFISKFPHYAKNVFIFSWSKWIKIEMCKLFNLYLVVFIYSLILYVESFFLNINLCGSIISPQGISKWDKK